MLVNAPAARPGAAASTGTRPGLRERYADQVLDVLAPRAARTSATGSAGARSARRPTWSAPPARPAARSTARRRTGRGPRCCARRTGPRCRGCTWSGGSAHPGGGLPIVALSAAIVADLDRAGGPRPRLAAAVVTRGGRRPRGGRARRRRPRPSRSRDTVAQPQPVSGVPAGRAPAAQAGDRDQDQAGRALGHRDRAEARASPPRRPGPAGTRAAASAPPAATHQAGGAPSTASVATSSRSPTRSAIASTTAPSGRARPVRSATAPSSPSSTPTRTTSTAASSGHRPPCGGDEGRAAGGGDPGHGQHVGGDPGDRPQRREPLHPAQPDPHERRRSDAAVQRGPALLAGLSSPRGHRAAGRLARSVTRQPEQPRPAVARGGCPVTATSVTRRCGGRPGSLRHPARPARVAGRRRGALWRRGRADGPAVTATGADERHEADASASSRPRPAGRRGRERRGRARCPIRRGGQRDRPRARPLPPGQRPRALGRGGDVLRRHRDRPDRARVAAPGRGARRGRRAGRGRRRRRRRDPAGPRHAGGAAHPHRHRAARCRRCRPRSCSSRRASTARACAARSCSSPRSARTGSPAGADACALLPIVAVAPGARARAARRRAGGLPALPRRRQPAGARRGDRLPRHVRAAVDRVAAALPAGRRRPDRHARAWRSAASRPAPSSRASCRGSCCSSPSRSTGRCRSAACRCSAPSPRSRCGCTSSTCWCWSATGSR